MSNIRAEIDATGRDMTVTVPRGSTGRYIVHLPDGTVLAEIDCEAPTREKQAAVRLPDLGKFDDLPLHYTWLSGR